MSKRQRIIDEYPYLKDDEITIHYDPCDGNVSTRRDDLYNDLKDPNLLYNVIVFDNPNLKNNTYILSTICNSVKFKSDWKINFIMPLKLDTKNDPKQLLFQSTYLSSDVIGIILEYTKVYVMSYQDFKFGVDCLYGHKWTEKERNNYIKYWNFPENEVEHTLVESLPPTSLNHMDVRTKNDQILLIEFETND